jgi:hypothetical protein
VEKRTPYSGLPTLAAMAIALAIGQLTGHESAGAIAAGASFPIGFAVFHETLASTLLSMGLTTLGIASATLAGSLGADHTWLVLLLVAIAAVNYGVLSGLSPTSSWIGQQCAVFVIVASYFPKGVHYAVGRTEMVLAGGALQMTFHAMVDLLWHKNLPAQAKSLGSRLEGRSRALWLQLRQETRSSADTISYTLRLMATLLLCTAIYRHYHVRNGYWSPMTALLVLKPQWTATLNRGVARLVGTLVGAGVATALAFYVHVSDPVVLALVVLAAWACYALQAVNYAAFSMFVTLYIVFLFRSGGFSQTSAAHIRLFNTALGGMVALLMDTAWMFVARQRRNSSHPKFVQ